MASPPGAGGSRYAGRVVDPDVREDGETEPEVELNPSPMRAATPAPDEEPARVESVDQAAAAPPSLPERASRGGDVRQRLLAKARAAEQASLAQPTSLDQELESIGRETARPTVDDEPFTSPPASGRAPSAPFTTGTPRELSPTLVALFSALVGIATIASITALFMSLETRLSKGTVPATATTAAALPAPSSEVKQDPRAKPKRQRQKIPGPWRLADAKGDPKYRFVEGKIGTDSFLKALEAAGAPEAQGYRVLAAMRGVLDLDNCKKSDRFQALLERGSSKLFALEYLTGPEDVYQAKEVDGRLTGRKLDLKIERAQVLGALSYDGASFEHSADVAGFDTGLSKVVQRALDGHTSLDELDRGDVLKVVVQEVTVLGDFARYAGVEALDLIRVDPAKAPLRIYYFDEPGLRGYYDREGRAPFALGWRKPIQGAPRTSPFNPNRLHPVLHKVMPHQGTDFGAAAGTPVGAASAGTVTFIGAAGPAGNLVRVMHPGGIETGYAHLSRFAEGLKVGDRVKSLQLLGYVGSTGRSTGPHLHFSASRDGVFFDAETLNLDGKRALTPEEREAFKPLLAKYDPMLDGIAMPERFAPLAPPTPAAAAAAPTTSGQAGVADELAAEGDEEETSAPPTQAADPSAKPVQPALAPAAAATRKPGSSAVYLTDQELREAQSATDDGEVDE